jgi:glycerol-1-phosphate dehydrogenase [NAD(P)+]
VDFHRHYLERLDPDGSFDCACGRRHRIATRQVLVGEKALGELPALLGDRYGRSLRIWVLSDDNTEAAAGARCKDLLTAWPVQAVVLPGSPKPRPTLELAEELTREAGARAPGLVLSVGSGVISDLGKKVAHELGIPNWCVATAPSVDAYTSGNSVFKGHSRHQTLWVTPSEAVICDLEVMATAPRELYLSGLGDLLAKFLAHLDWNLSARISGEYLCGESIRAARESALRPLRLLAGAGSLASQELLGSLTDALLTTGFLMQALGSSRPASSAEHTASFIWEIAGLAGNQRLNLHGLLVALAGRLVLEVYREFYNSLSGLTVDVPARVRALASEPSWEEHLDPGMAIFAEQMRTEMSAAKPGPEAWRRRLTAFRREREALGELAGAALHDLEQGITALGVVGLPFEPAAFEMTPAAAYLPFPYLRLLRNRYNSFWLMHELGAEEAPLAGLRRLLGLS